MPTVLIAWLLGVAELALAAALLGSGIEEAAVPALGMALWMLTWACGGRR
jgi:hypothetical protein